MSRNSSCRSRQNHSNCTFSNSLDFYRQNKMKCKTNVSTIHTFQNVISRSFEWNVLYNISRQLELHLLLNRTNLYGCRNVRAFNQRYKQFSTIASPKFSQNKYIDQFSTVKEYFNPVKFKMVLNLLYLI